ncbi:hypothetical protein [Saccharopolyspora aridisoli]|uniref:hypothetical protein n=1 Tax=Saccharopolyspora aridisoli TaxID=2530385 RepID=UPI00140484AB|nr:hypothetical protein [Saccharopolyspora aridisoli]
MSPEPPRSRCGRKTPPAETKPEENAMTWETPGYTVIDVCAEVTGYLHRADED